MVQHFNVNHLVMMYYKGGWSIFTLDGNLPGYDKRTMAFLIAFIHAEHAQVLFNFLNINQLVYRWERFSQNVTMGLVLISTLVSLNCQLVFFII